MPSVRITVDASSTSGVIATIMIRSVGSTYSSELASTSHSSPVVTTATRLEVILLKSMYAFAMGEAIAHLNHLVTLGLMELDETPARVRYRRIGAKDARVEPEFV